MWVTLGGPPGEKSILFEYDPSRSGEVPMRLLDGFTGYLQTDGYSGYNAVCQKNGIIQLGCWDNGIHLTKAPIHLVKKSIFF